ncbi:hypothetical protein BU24DRAFT_35924 [Aaosphaeria arxii CBS 175.79]|uniref:WW domain-containing protein n=1 Tax=Aaosphaeria arxii CBS 175.79 TaxID=1450172 RepID=A0A6A5Y9D3_9PLEO|nr:uncharacterized protein BU24DRAFT_35924 [Aaosphaeria arxii CBS 175.79]KAF2022028.1 hypothetical protein BU24DRAFT_35924 [Aaosphaeria arxii CBS 175.79]
MASYDLGAMTGGRFHQYANRVGQVYYVDTLTNATRFSIPRGLEDVPSVSYCSRLISQYLAYGTGHLDPGPIKKLATMVIPGVLQYTMNDPE